MNYAVIKLNLRSGKPRAALVLAPLQIISAVLVRDCWAKDWNGQGVCIAAGSSGTIVQGQFATDDGRWEFPVTSEDFRTIN